MKLFHLFLTGTVLNLVIFTATLLFSCSFNNPFEDYSNVNILVKSDISPVDTVEIFQIDSIDIDLVVGDLIKTLSFESPGNRFYTDTLIQISSLDSIPTFFRFKCSFYDTGSHQVRFRVTKRNGEEILQDILIFALNPLRQDSIRGFIGDSIHLSPEGVKDDDVLYHWFFGNGVQITSRSITSEQQIYGDLRNCFKGQFWVSDLSEKHRSPGVDFFFNLIDTAGPKIECVSCNGDTAITTGSEFRFIVSISDDGTGPPVYATANNRLLICENELLYYQDFSQTDTLTKSKLIVVKAKDNSGNESDKNFWIKYDPSSKYIIKPQLTISTPVKDRQIVNKDSIEVAGVLTWYSQPAKYSVIIYADDIAMDTSKNLEANKGHWGTAIALRSGINLLKIVVIDSSGAEVTNAERYVIYEKNNGEDNTPPRIVDVSVNQISIKNSWVLEDGNPIISVIAFDESRIKTVKIDTMYASVKNGYSWECKVPVSHFGRKIDIVVTDESGLFSTYPITLRQNFIPKIIANNIQKSIYKAGDTVRGVLIATDENISDKPLLRYYCKTAGVKIDSITGEYQWIVEPADIRKTVQFEVSDALVRSSFETVFEISKDSIKTPNPIQIVTAGEKIPDFLVADRDSLSGTVLVNGGKNPSLSVHTLKPTANPPVITGSKLLWYPHESDTGLQKIIITASDTSGDSTSLNISIMVFSKNDTFTTTSNWNGLQNPDKSLNLSGSGSFNTLTVRILGYTGDFSNFDIRYTLVGKTFIDSIKNSVYQIKLDTDAKASGRDSIVIIVTNKDAISKRIVKQLDYGNPPEIPVITSPLSNATIVTNSCVLTWQCDDPDKNPLSYTVLKAEEDGVFNVCGATTKTTLSCSGLIKTGSCYFKVVASDGKSSSESNVVRVTVMPQNRIKFSMSDSEFPKFIQADSTWAIAIKTINGTPPYRYSIWSDTKVKPLLDSFNTIHWKPVEADTGKRHLKIQVVDSIGNSDSMDVFIWIVSTHYTPELTWSSSITVNGYIDLHTTSKPETINFKINDNDPIEIERFSIKTKINNIESEQSLLSRKTFSAVVKPDITRGPLDSIYVCITDIWGLKDTVLIPVFYGNAPDRPISITPGAGDKIPADTAVFSWKCKDPDGDALQYDLFLGSDPDSLVKVNTTDKTTIKIPGLAKAEYYYKLTATDGLHLSEGSVVKFEVE